MKFSEVITTDRGDVHAKGKGQRSMVKVLEVKTIFSSICAFPGHNYFSLNSRMATKLCKKLDVS